VKLNDDQLRELLQARAELPIPSTGDEILAEAARRSRIRASRFRAGIALAAVLALAVGGLLLRPPSSDLTARGIEPSTASIELGWLVEGLGVKRAADPRIGPDEAVIFKIRTTSAGWICLDERVGGEWSRIFPVGDAAPWRIDPGVQLIGDGEVIQSFRSDHGPGERDYRVLQDPADPACSAPVASSRARLQWLP
jgi:hypothetical protein